MAAFVLGGTHGGAGKSVVAAAVVGALRDRGLDVRNFTIGPAFTHQAEDESTSLPAADACSAGAPVTPCGCGDCDGLDGDAAAAQPTAARAAALPQGPCCIDLGLTQDLDLTLACFQRAAEGADVCVVDGSLAVLDAAGPAARGGSGGTANGSADERANSSSTGDSEAGCSTAEVSRALGLPLVLVVDVAALRSAASVAALLQGYSTYGGGLQIAGLVLNRVAGKEQADEMAARLKAAGVTAPVVAALPQLAPARELAGGGGGGSAVHTGSSGSGWGGAATQPPSPQPPFDVPWGENGLVVKQQQQQQQLAAAARKQLICDLDLLLSIARTAKVPAPTVPLPPPARSFRVAVGVACDEAFHRYFQQNLLLLASAGAQLVPFSPLHDAQLPAGLSAILIGGGEPEQWAARLASNAGMLAALRAFASAGGIVAAEGAGAMYLAATMQTAPGQRHTMAGLLPFHVVALPPEQRTSGYVDVCTFGPCPHLKSGTQLRGFFERCCEVVVVEERLVQGLGAPAGGGAGGGGGYHNSSGRVSDSGSSFSYSGSLGMGSYTHCYEARMQGCGPVPEGYTNGSVIASSIHTFLGSCPAAAGQVVQRCLRVDVAATSSAAGQAARFALAALAAAQASAGSAAAGSPDSAAGGRRGPAPPRSPSDASDAAASTPSGSCTTPPAAGNGTAGPGPSPWRRMGAKSTPDLLRYSHEAVAGSDAGSELFGYWAQPQTSPCNGGGDGVAGGSGAGVPPTQHPLQQQQHQQLSQRQRVGGPAAAAVGQPQQQQQQQTWQPRQLGSLKSMSIPANMHRLAVEHQQAAQQQPQAVAAALSSSLPFSVPKRWSLELQRLGSMLPGSGSGNNRAGDAGRSRGGGSGAGGPAAGANPLHRRTGSYGSYARLSAALDAGVEPLPEATAAAIATHLPTTGRSHAKMIGLACPLGAPAGDSVGAGVPGLGMGLGLPQVVGGRVVHPSGSFGSLAQLPPLHQPRPHSPSPLAAQGGNAAAASAAAEPGGDSGSERVSDGASSVGPSISGNLSSGQDWQQQQQQQQQQAGYYGPPLLGPLAMSRRSSVSYEPHQFQQHSASHTPTAEAGATPAISRVPSAHAHNGWGGPPPLAGGPVTAAAPPPHRRNASTNSLPARPARGDIVVSLSPSATAALVALGLGPRLAGVTDACRVPGGANTTTASASADAQPEVVCAAAVGPGGRLHRRIDADAIRRIRPALVVVPRSGGGDGEWGSEGGGGAPERAAMQKALERSGVLWPESGAVVLYQRCFTLAEVLEFVGVLASAAGVPEQGTLLCERLRARLRQIAAAVRAPPPRAPSQPPQAQAPRVAVLSCCDTGALTLAGLWVPELLQLAGAAPLPGAPAPGEPHARIEWSALQRAAPGVLIVCTPGGGALDAAARTGALAALPGWWGLPAVRAGRVYVFDAALIAEPGVELAEGAALLAHLLRPAAVPAPPCAAPPSGAEAPCALRLTLSGGQRCRPRLLPNFFSTLH